MAMKHEGKMTGLAAHGEPRYVDLLDRFITYRSGTFVNDAGLVFDEAIRELKRRLPTDATREDMAASIQIHAENLVRRFVDHWARHTGLEDLALAGGIFANVRINEEVLELDGVRRIHVHPHMGDGGLCVGAAAATVLPGLTPAPMENPHRAIEDVYLGTDLSDGDIVSALADQGLVPETIDGNIAEIVAELLAQGYVVARAAGRMEYGPRALGNRTIMYHPTDASVNDWLNANLGRTEFMPFAPAILAEEADRCFENHRGGEHAAEFMTVTFHCTDWMSQYMPGVIHIDGTVRPQLVRKDTANTGYRAILEAFHSKTGLPGIINTSFILGDRLIAHPKGVQHPLQPVIPARADRLVAAS
jgi:carbamoyltransferase